jgi:hypothetical protein
MRSLAEHENETASQRGLEWIHAPETWLGMPATRVLVLLMTKERAAYEQAHPEAKSIVGSPVPHSLWPQSISSASTLKDAMDDAQRRKAAAPALTSAERTLRHKAIALTLRMLGAEEARACMDAGELQPRGGPKQESMAEQEQVEVQIEGQPHQLPQQPQQEPEEEQKQEEPKQEQAQAQDQAQAAAPVQAEQASPSAAEAQEQPSSSQAAEQQPSPSAAAEQAEQPAQAAQPEQAEQPAQPEQ